VWRGVKKEEGINNTQKEGEKRFERKGDIFTIKIVGSVVMMVLARGERELEGMQGKLFLHLPPDSITLTTDIESHLRTLETKGNLSVMSAS
jgi:hypothetical protein